ncbi:SMP-30/gluconolactonase/LRE family protein [Paracandidimonas soli]|uniref:Gluconolactonase n=1 Tax=Paracandidimonas soli TaxID=1917182 RepID=A0A4R3URE3_9BURK|nr:SMP-30/gluconolactonase/LRE family protein [Paracandidimonas soli]TCU94485.1 gluconolactonase [Paracandidimonas soli]
MHAATKLSGRYPDPLVQAFEPSFEALILPLAGVERLADGCRWAEGPVWFGDGRYLLWSDIPNDRVMKWDETTQTSSVWRHGSNNANGMTRDRQGRLIVCEHLGRRVTRTEYDGRITVLASHFNGKPFNSPNDAVVKSDGSIWFTDPPFGIAGYYQGEKAEQELPAGIYRIDPDTLAISLISDAVQGPNGLAFSPDEQLLYVIESRSRPRNIRLFALDPGGKSVSRPTAPDLFLSAGEGTPDGFRVDIHGNLWCGWGMGSAELDGVRVFSPESQMLGHISLPERCANLCFGGKYRNRLFMAASTSIYSLYVNTQGC